MNRNNHHSINRFFPLIISLLAGVSQQASAQEIPPSRERVNDPKEVSTIERNNNGRKVMIKHLPVEEGEIYIEEMKRIKEAKKELLKQQAAQKSKARFSGNALVQKSFVVSATILDDQTSLVKCWSTDGGPEVRAHSNCNWSHFVGQQFFQDGNIQYSFLLLPTVHQGNNEGSAVMVKPDELPEIRKSGARYMVMEGEEEETLDFLESIHQRYDREKKILIREFRNRQKDAKERAHQMRVNPPKPRDVIIRFGRRNPKSSDAEKLRTRNRP